MKNPTYTKALRRELRQHSTNSEKIFWKNVRNRKWKGIKIKRQYGVGNYVVDFFCPELSIAIELDGSVHDLPNQRNHDKNRDKYLREQGIEVIRISNSAVENHISTTLSDLYKVIKAKRGSLSLEGEG